MSSRKINSCMSPRLKQSRNPLHVFLLTLAKTVKVHSVLSKMGWGGGGGVLEEGCP